MGTKYFLNMEKRNYNKRYIKKLETGYGLEITDPSEILNEQKKFYSDLYSSSNLNVRSNNAADKTLSNIPIPKLNNLEKKLCDENLTISEIAMALRELPNDKTPGSDGFTTNFYKFFWSDIRMLLYDSFAYTFSNGSLSDDQRRGIINIIPNDGKDLRFLRNWRPVSLLNTDYKILTKTLSNRLQKVLPKLIHTDQVGYIKGRYIGQNVRIIKDIMTYVENKDLSGYLLLVDFEKAFDKVEWSFMLKCLEAYSFGNNFMKWIKILYTNIQSCVSNNGYLSQYFNLSRGIRQGCPISAMLFILVSETLAILLRENKSIQGIVVNNEEYKLCQLADDTTLIVANMKSILESISCLNLFYTHSGLKINLEKSIIIPMGRCRNKL